MAVVEESTWSPPTTRPNIAPGKDDRAKFAKQKGLPAEAIGYSDFITNGKMNMDDVLRPIYEEAGKALGREFPYPEHGKTK
jgi:ribonuclease Z